MAIEYPRRGAWSLAFVTGENLPEFARLTAEPVLTVLVPTCPVPIAGYVKIVPKSDVLEVDMTVDQAVQYIVSWGVVGRSPAVESPPSAAEDINRCHAAETIST